LLGFFINLYRMNLFRKKKEPVDLNAKLLPELCSCTIIQWNYSDDIGMEAIYAEDIPFMFDARKCVGVQAEVEFRNDGTYYVGQRTLALMQGVDNAIVIDVPYNEFKKHFQELKSNIITNDYIISRG
jgi:hypothetical protein